MSVRRLISMGVVAMLWVPAPVFADEVAEWPHVSGSAGLGLLASSGNTDGSSARVTASTQLDYEHWRHRFKLLGYHAAEERETTAQRHALSAQSDYWLTSRNYLFGHVETERDRFGPYERRETITAGPGRRFVDGPVLRVEAELGAGRIYQWPVATGRRESEGIVRFYGEVLWRFAESSRFGQDLEIEDGSSNRYTESETWVSFRIVGNLHSRLSHTIRHNSEVPADTDRTDTLTAISLEYDF